MERLTKRDEYGNADIIALSNVMTEMYAELSFSETNALTNALNRLAAYEDTGLEPEAIGKWIPLKTRPMDEDERKELADKLGYEPEDYEAVIYTSPFPDVGQEVLICLKSGDIRIDTFEEDDLGCYFCEYDDMENVVAWMPLPRPYERIEKK